MELQEKRKMNELLRGIIGAGYYGTQEDLKSELHGNGFLVNQSTISRALKKIGVVKVSLPNGGSRYELNTKNTLLDYGGKLHNLVHSIRCNESMIVIKTSPGAAMFIAGQLDHYCKDFVLGTIAGDDTIFISPRTCIDISISLQAIQDYLY